MSKKRHEQEAARARAKRLAAQAQARRRRQAIGIGATLVVAIVAVIVGLQLAGDDDPDVAIDGDGSATNTDQLGSESPEATASDDPTDDASGGGTPTAAPPMVIDPEASYTAVVETEEGPIVVELAAADAPTTVNNFVALASVGFYDGVVFHRVSEDFVIQGGDPLGNGSGGPGYQFDDELALAEQVVADSDGNYPRGTLAMANSGPDTNGSQFFIVDADPGYAFPPNYTVFGKVLEGLEAVDAIAAGEVTGPNGDQAVDPVAITSITIDGPVDADALADFQPRAG